MSTNKRNILKHMSEANAIQHAETLISSNISNLQAVCQDIDEKLIQEANNGNNALFLSEYNLSKLFNKNNIDTASYTNENILCLAIATLYNNSNLITNITYDSLNNVETLYISWDMEQPNKKDITAIIQNNSLINSASNFSSELLNKYQINKSQTNASNSSLSNTQSTNTRNNLKLANMNNSNTDVDVNAQTNISRITRSNPLYNKANKYNYKSTLNSLNKTYTKFAQYFGTKYLTKEIKNGHYIIRLQVYENNIQKYLFVWNINCKTYDDYYERKIFNTSKFILIDETTGKEFNASPLINNSNSDSPYTEYPLADKTILPIIHGYMRSKKRIALYNQARYIYDLASLKTACAKYKMYNIIWFNATAPNSLYLNTKTKKPQLRLIANIAPSFTNGLYFLNDFNWDKYHSKLYAEKLFYQYVWHEIVNFYYFKQDYYLYHKIFDFGHDIDFRKTFANYSVNCQFLTTKANIIKDSNNHKNTNDPWFTARTATYDSNNIDADNYYK